MMTLPNITVDFVLFLTTNHVARPERLRIGVDDTELMCVHMPQEVVKITTVLGVGPHEFWIELCDKAIDNELRVNGELINDTYVKINNISINNSMMNHLVNDNAYTKPDWEHHQDVAKWFLENRGSVPERIQNSNYLNLKGYYYFDFSLPLKEYLDRNIDIDPAYKRYYNSSLERYKQLKQKLINLQDSNGKNNLH